MDTSSVSASVGAQFVPPSRPDPSTQVQNQPPAPAENESGERGADNEAAEGRGNKVNVVA